MRRPRGAGSGVDDAGHVVFPVLDIAYFLEAFAGMPFEQFVGRVRSAASAVPNTTTAPPSSPPRPPAIPLLAGLIALLASVLWLPSRSPFIARGTPLPR